MYDLCTQIVSFCPYLINILLKVFKKRLSFLYLAFQFLNLPAASQQIAGIFKRASAHGTARIQQFSVRRNNAERVFVFSRKGDRMIDVVYDNSPA